MNINWSRNVCVYGISVMATYNTKTDNRKPSCCWTKLRIFKGTNSKRKQEKILNCHYISLMGFNKPLLTGNILMKMYFFVYVW